MTHHIPSLRVSALALAAALGLCLALPAGAAEPASPGVVNVNTATVDQLQLLPGVGESRARSILAARDARGGFDAIDDLVEVKGIGPAGLERMRPYLRLKGKTTAGTP